MNINEFVAQYKECPFCNKQMQLKIAKGSGAISHISSDNDVLSFQTIAREWPMSPNSYNHVWMTYVNLNTCVVSVDYIDATTKLPSETISVNAIKKYVQSKVVRRIYYSCSGDKCFSYDVDGFLDTDLHTGLAYVIGAIQSFKVDKYAISNNLSYNSVVVYEYDGNIVTLENSYWSPEQIKSSEIHNRLDFFHLFA